MRGTTEASDLGFQDYVAKPVDARKLLPGRPRLAGLRASEGGNGAGARRKPSTAGRQEAGG
jgi:hypothetical protein